MVKLTTKEEEVMEQVWKLKETTPKEVMMQYDEPRPHINTISTVIQILEQKGYVSHYPKGRGYVYFPTVDKDEYAKHKFGSLVDRYFDNSYMNVVSALVTEEKVTREELLDFIETLKK